MMQPINNSSNSDQNQMIKSANPELTKVLSEEPSVLVKEEKKREDGNIKVEPKGESKSERKSQKPHIKLPQHVSAAAHQQPCTPNQFMNGNISPPWNQSPNLNYPAHQNSNWNNLRQNSYPMGNGSPIWTPNMPLNGPDISQSRVPDESLTPEQLQRREAGIESLKRIHKMLLADDQCDRAVGTDFSNIMMAQDSQISQMHPDDYGYNPSMMHMMSPGPPVNPPGAHMGPVPGMHPHMIGNSMPMPCNPAHMNGPMGSHPMNSGRPMDMGPYPGGPPMMHQKPPPPYAAPMHMTELPRKSKAKKRKPNPQSSPTSPIGHPMKSPKYQIPPSPLAGPGGMPPNMAPQFPSPEQSFQPNGMLNYKQHGMNSGPHPQGSQGSLMQAGHPEPYQGSMPMTSSGKPPPSYTQCTKHGTIESMTTPPGVQYYSQFENQELTIIKQRNSSYQESSNTSDQYSMNPNLRAGVNPGSPISSSRPSSITNITSTSLANLAKGVEQMQQNMMEGGPFRDLQQQSVAPQGHQALLQGPSNQHSMNMPPGNPNNAPQASGPPTSQPSVNNTYVNAQLSIGQVNIQNVNTSQQQSAFDSHGRQMSQEINGSHNAGIPNNGSSRFNEDPAFNSSQQIPNPSVKVQASRPNTVQYMPVHQNALPPNGDPMMSSKQSFDYVEGYQAALTNLENKAPTSKINYYPDNSRLPPPPPQRLPMSVNGPSPHSGVMPLNPPGGMFNNPSAMMRPSMGMLVSPPTQHMSSFPPSSHHQYPMQPHGQSMIPGMYPPNGHYPHNGLPVMDGPPAPIGMMEPIHAANLHPSQGMMMPHSQSLPMMGQPQSPYTHCGPPDFGSHMPPHHNYPADYPPQMGGPPQLTRQMSHPGSQSSQSQSMMIPQPGGPYMGGPTQGPPYIMGGP